MAAETTKEAIDVVSKALDLYNKLLDRIMPWKTFEEQINEMNKNIEVFSNEVKETIAIIKGHMSDGISAYARSTRSIYDWTSVAIPFLNAYIQLFNENTADDAKAQKTILVGLLDEGMKSMTNAQTELDVSSSSFNKAAGKLTSIRQILFLELKSKKEKYQRDYERAKRPPIFGLLPYVHARLMNKKNEKKLIANLESVSNFYDTMEHTTLKASTDIEDTKSKLRDETRIIGNLIVETKTTQVFVNMDHSLEDLIIESVEDLIQKCNQFRQKHIK